MDESELEGTLVLEKLAAIGKIDAFYEAVDADDFVKIKSLMICAGADAEAIDLVLKKIIED